MGVAGVFSQGQEDSGLLPGDSACLTPQRPVSKRRCLGVPVALLRHRNQKQLGNERAYSSLQFLGHTPSSKEVRAGIINPRGNDQSSHSQTKAKANS